ncbi:MAG TPA: hypothetical protein VHT03_14695 [Rhizomicrobium sp.]|jgi:hypothetical protein|nr:hypothetical protein [Rhizomicrobium sp.]
MIEQTVGDTALPELQGKRGSSPGQALLLGQLIFVEMDWGFGSAVLIPVLIWL